MLPASVSSALMSATASMASIALSTRCTCNIWRIFLVSNSTTTYCLDMQSEEEAKLKKRVYHQGYYQRNKERIDKQAKEWKEAHREYVRDYMRDYAIKRKERELTEKKKTKPDLAKAKALFRNPEQAAHLQWLVNHAIKKKSSKTSL